MLFAKTIDGVSPDEIDGEALGDGGWATMIFQPIKQSLILNINVLFSCSWWESFWRNVGLWPLFLFGFLFVLYHERAAVDPEAVRRKREQTRFLVAVELSACLLFSLGFSIFLFWAPDLSKEWESIHTLIETPTACIPEPLERTIFLLCLLCSPLIVFVSLRVADRLTTLFDKRIDGLFLSAAAFPIVVFFLLQLLFSYSIFSEAGFYLLFPTGFPSWALYVCVLFPFMVWAARQHGRFGNLVIVFGGIVVALLLIYRFVIFLFNNRELPALEHFNVVYYPIAQVVQGKTILVDFPTQYGMYAHFLEPVFRWIGVGIFPISVVMGLLVLLSSVSLIGFLWQIVSSRFLLVWGTLFLLFYHQYGFILTGDTDVAHPLLGSEPYFQYSPIRTLGPCLGLFLMGSYYQCRCRLLFAASYVVAASSLFWNVDSGVPIFVTWVASRLFDDLLLRKNVDGRLVLRLAQTLGIALIVLAIAVAAVSVSLGLRSGRWPSPELLFLYSNICYRHGYFMLPMPLFGLWNPVILVYLVGLSLSVDAVVRRRDTPEIRGIMMLTFLGLGLFAYYQGRSAEGNLQSCMYPAIMLFVLFTDVVHREIVKISTNVRATGYHLIFFCCVFVLGLVAFSLPSFFPSMAKCLEKKRTLLASGPTSPLLEDAAMIARHTRPGEAVFVVDLNHDGLDYGLSRTCCAAELPSSREWLLREQVEKAYEFVCTNTQHKVFVRESKFRPSELPLDDYIEKDRTSSNLVYYEPKSKASEKRSAAQGD